MLVLVNSADDRRLQAAHARLQKLGAQLTPTGFISSGTLVRRFMTCGKPNCRCHADPPQLHGPYWQLNRLVGGRMTTRHLNQAQADLYQEWIANRRRLTKTIAEINKVSQGATQILLEAAGSSRIKPSEEPQPQLQNVDQTPTKTSSSPRMTRRSAEALVQASELMTSLADAAQEWLDAKEEEDRDLIAEARDAFRQALTGAAELDDLLPQIARLLPAD